MLKQESKYLINPKLDFVSEETVSAFIDEEKDIVHFVEDIEMEILELLKTPISFSELSKSVSMLYSGFVEKDLEDFFEDLVAKEIICAVE